MCTRSLTLMVAVIAVALLAAGHVPASAQGTSSGVPTTTIIAGGASLDTGVYTSGSDAVVYTPVSQFSHWLHRMSHNEGNHSDKNKGWIGAGALLFLF